MPTRSTMYNKKQKKTIYVLNVDGYSPEITAMTYPLIKLYAKRIGADFHVISERKFPDFPPVYEKLQIYELAQLHDNDWNIYIDSDAIVHPETIDFTNYISKDTVAHYGSDMANIRWDYDRYFRRDGRNIGSCNWFTIASDLCIELWKPLDDITLDEAIDMIHPTVHEDATVIEKSHLIDDFTLSRNIAKYGLKFKELKTLVPTLGLSNPEFFYHQYTIKADEKLAMMMAVVKEWRLEKYIKEG